MTNPFAGATAKSSRRGDWRSSSGCSFLDHARSTVSFAVLIFLVALGLYIYALGVIALIAQVRGLFS